MNITLEKLSKDIINQILTDIGTLESDGSIKFSLTKAERWKIATKWKDTISTILDNAINKNKSYTAAFDGGSTPNPGEMKIGGWIRDPNGIRIYAYTEEIGYGTNNEAEYKSLIKLLEEVKKRGIQTIHIKGDSALVVNQVTGKWKVKDPKMKILKAKACSVGEGINFKLEHVLRKFNSEADSLT